MWFLQYEYTASGTTLNFRNEISLNLENLNDRIEAIKRAQEWLSKKPEVSHPFLVWKETLE